MRLLSVSLGAADLDALRAFYAGALGMRIVEDSDEVLALRAGWSMLRFERVEKAPPAAHFAFNIPPDSMDRAQAWLGARAELLREEGATRFEFASWDAEAIYAMDPAGNVIELIARRRLRDRLGGGAFDASCLLCVSEIGIVTEDPPRAARGLCDAFGLSIFSAADADFATVGDDEGLFIVVPPGRAWKPTEDVMSLPAPARIVIEAGAGREWSVGPSIVRSERPGEGGRRTA